MRQVYPAPRRRKRLLPKVLLGLLAVVVLLIGVIALYVNNLLNKIEYEDEFTVPTISGAVTDEHNNLIIPELDPADHDALPTEYAPLSDSDLAIIAEDVLAASEDDTELMSDSNVINIMLIGTDNRERGQYRLSDSMILLSINRSKGKIVMTSLMRDIYAHIPGRGNTKLNAAVAVGGPNLLLQTVRNTFKIDVQQYMMVDFYSLAEIIDVLGGISINVSAAEVSEINKHVRQFAPGRELLSGSGQMLLNGPQAVGYARIRKVGHADFQRTERQRTVLTQIINKTKSSSVATLNNLLNSILPRIQTNISKGTFLEYLTIAPTVLNYQVSQLRIPAQGAYTGASFPGIGDSLVIDINKAREALFSSIY
ncbi:MAG: LCP family protein [Bacillota bacterium]|nr:LCP family protein [Bacillota bacterium]